MTETDTPPDVVPPSQLPEALVAAGRYWVTTSEFERLTGSSRSSARQAAARLIKQGRLISPARGLYVVVPPEYRTWRSVPPEWFIDPMMAHLDRTYYVGLLTSAAMHGAAHQAPQTFQVLTSKPLADRDLGRAHLRFITNEHLSDMTTERRTTQTGMFTIASRDTTAVDLVWRLREAGGISNVATVLIEIGELDGDRLARLSPHRNRATSRRLGWLLERFRDDVDPHWLQVVAEPAEGEPVKLSPYAPKRGHIDRRWGVLVNTSVEPDV